MNKSIESNKYLMAVLRQIRVHQWVKNILIFAPVIAAHKPLTGEGARDLLLAFSAFSTLASSVYVWNDLKDIEQDRKHPRKCRRPLASGQISERTGILLLVALLFVTALIGAILPMGLGVALATYLGLNVFYTLWGKSVAILDCIILALFYTLRLVAGGQVAQVEISSWLLSFSLFFFLGLAVVKRYVELARMTEAKTTFGRGYEPGDKIVIMSLGVACSFVSILVMSLYFHSEQVLVLYRSPIFLWPTSLVMTYWLGRIWLLAHRGTLHDDPVVFAIKDPASLLCGVLLLGLMFLSN